MHETRNTTRRNGTAALALAALLAGCGELEDERTIDLTRTASAAERHAVVGATSAERFGGMGAGRDPHAASEASRTPTPELRWDLPEGWVELAPTQVRRVNLRVEGDPGAECSLSILQGDGGGVRGNIDRWRDQMGLGPISAEELAALPHRKLLAQDAVMVEIDGDYRGMGTEAQPGWRMYGLILEIPQAAIFVKMTGPQDLLAAERERFLAFCDSLRLESPAADADEHAGHDHAPGEPHDDEAAAPSSGGASASGLRWTAPAGWMQESARPAREVTFRLGTDGATECYVSLLGGDAGGVVANLSRWRGQLGLGAITPAEIDALERVTVLGQSVPLFEAYGSYTGMDGRAVPDAGMLGVAATFGRGTLFVKMVGPTADVKAARADFVAFCASLEGS